MSQTTNLGKVCVTPKGTHDSTLEYKILDIVTNNGSSYIAIQDVPANIQINNTTYWQLIASKGGTGEITEVTASISGGYGTPGVTVTEGGTTTEKTLAFAFTNLVGNGISSIVGEKTGTSGAVDTYTLTITYQSGDTDTVTYTVTNGSVTSVNGKTGDVVLDAEDIGFDGTASELDATNTQDAIDETITDLKNGTIVTGHSAVADNLTPYSEDSGTTQENPFISQGTGTDNNSVIVTTGNIARQLEKQGNTVAKIQLGKVFNSTNWSVSNGNATYNNGVATFTASAQFGRIEENINLIKGHKYLISIEAKGTSSFTLPMAGTLTSNGPIKQTLMGVSFSANNTKQYVIATLEQDIPYLSIIDTRASDWDSWQVQKLITLDITAYFKGNDNIPADLLTNPEHITWYLNDFTYDAGSLQNCNGRYLECGQGRNLWNEDWEVGGFSTTGEKETNNNHIRSKEPIMVIPNTKIYAYGVTDRICLYDKNMNFISRTTTNPTVVNCPSNCQYINIEMIGSTYGENVTISLYYTPEQGGEGYDQYYPYVPPIRIDTGDETLKAFDKKLPSGVITRATGSGDLSTFTFTAVGSSGKLVASNDIVSLVKRPANNETKANIICTNYENVPTSYLNNTGEVSVGTDGVIYIRVPDNTSFTITGEIEYELATPTTEQGTPYSEYADINDYSYMAWFDTDGNLVSIPQGCKLFYPVDYKGFLDDGVMYTDGDFTSLAKLEDITDSALNARGYYKMQDLSSSVTNSAGLTVNIKKLIKQGNVYTLTLFAVNETGSTITNPSTLFTIPSGAYDSNNNMTFFSTITGSTTKISVMKNGTIICADDIPDGSGFFFSASYVVD